MKKIYINMKVLVAILLISNQMFVSGQTQVTRYTPKGSPVRAYNNIPEMSSTDKADWSTNVLIYYPNATQINPPSATRSYNCHAYAWHVKEGGDAVWIGYYLGQEADEDIYWTDGSYVEQPSEANAEKISYYTGNHSAVQSDIQGVYISKWGPGPLMRHQRDDGPSIYNMTYRKYYKKALANPTISGPSQVCDQATYTVDNLPAGATVVWSANPSGIVSLQPNGSSVTLTKVSGGNVTLSATINNSYTVTKDVWVGVQASFTGSASVNYLGMGTWNSYVSCTGLYTFQWWLRKANTGVASMCVSNDPELTLRSVAQGSAKLAQSTKPPIVNQPVSYTIFYMFLRVTDASGFQYDTPEQQIYAYGKVDLVPALLLKANNDVQVSDQVKSMEIFPNPASSEVKISINPTSSPSLHVVSSNSSDNTNLNSYSVNVIDVYGSIVYTDTKVEEQFTIPISKLRNGVYNVIVSDGTNTYQNKLIVKH